MSALRQRARLWNAAPPGKNRYRWFTERLRGEPDPTAAQRQRLAALEDELGRLRQLGVTQREQLMLQTADKLIAERRRRGDAKVPGHLADLMADLWNRS